MLEHFLTDGFSSLVDICEGKVAFLREFSPGNRYGWLKGNRLDCCSISPSARAMSIHHLLAEYIIVDVNSIWS